MKKFLLTSAILVLSGSAFAQYAGPTTHTPTMTVQQLKQAPDETYTTIVGNIVRHIREEHYVFADKTGQINVEIDYYLLPQTKFDAKTRVSLTGKLDREWDEPTRFDVNELRILP